MFGGNTQDLGALHGRQRFTIGNEVEKAVQRRQSAVPGTNRTLSYLFDILQECDNLNRGEVGQAQFGNGLRLLCGYETEEQPPTVPVRQHGVMGDIALLRQPVVKEGV